MRTAQTSARARANSADLQKALAGWLILSTGLFFAVLTRWREFARP